MLALVLLAIAASTEAVDAPDVVAWSMPDRAVIEADASVDVVYIRPSGERIEQSSRAESRLTKDVDRFSIHYESGNREFEYLWTESLRGVRYSRQGRGDIFDTPSVVESDLFRTLPDAVLLGYFPCEEYPLSETLGTVTEVQRVPGGDGAEAITFRGDGGKYVFTVSTADRAIRTVKITKGPEDRINGVLLSTPVSNWLDDDRPSMTKYELTCNVVDSDVVSGMPARAQLEIAVHFTDGTVRTETQTIHRRLIDLDPVVDGAAMPPPFQEGDRIMRRSAQGSGAMFEWRGGEVVPYVPAVAKKALTATVSQLKDEAREGSVSTSEGGAYRRTLLGGAAALVALLLFVVYRVRTR